MPEQILDTDDLLRRVIFTDPNYVRPDFTASSFAFTPRKIDGVQESLSVDINRLTTHEQSIVDRSRFRLYSLAASSVREIGLNCEHDPLPDNAAHALIVGNITKSVAKRLSQIAVRIHYPD